MGTWGAGNFESDHALDHVGRMVAAELASVAVAIRTKSVYRLDQAMVDVEVAAALSSHSCDAMPEDVRQLRDKFLEAYEKAWRKEQPEEYAAFYRQRVRVIEKTFAKLHREAVKCHGRPKHRER